MNREIKFRALTKDTKEWVYGTFMVIRNCFDETDTEEKIMFFDSKFINGHEIIGDCWIEVIPETVGQFTGLKDKNGVEIYEGDTYVVKNGIYIVFFKNGSFCAGKSFEMCMPISFSVDKYSNLEYDGFHKEIEITGNIHDKK